MAREQRKPTVEEGQARHAARYVRTWRDEHRGMLCGRFELPDVMGAKFEATIKKLVESMRPPKGQPWPRRECRAADVLGVMCEAVDAMERIEAPMAATPPLLVVEVGTHGPATIVDIPLPDAMVEQLRAMASVEPMLVGDDGFPMALGDARAACRRRSSAP